MKLMQNVAIKPLKHGEDPPPRCSYILGDQQSRWFIDPAFGWWSMSSWKLPQNVVQGHLVTFGPGAKYQMEQHNFIPLDSAGLYRKGWYGNTIYSLTVEFFAEFTHQCKSCIQGNWAKL